MGIVRTVFSVSAPIWFIINFYQRSRRSDKNGQSVDIGSIEQYWTQNTVSVVVRGKSLLRILCLSYNVKPPKQLTNCLNGEEISVVIMVF